MLRKQGRDGYIKRPPYRDTYQLPGIHHQAWSPVDDWYHTFSQRKGDFLYIFTLLGDFNTGATLADIFTMFGVPHAGSEVIRDPLLVFATLEAGDRGYCIFQNDIYWAIQAPCPPEFDIDNTPELPPQFPPE